MHNEVLTQNQKDLYSLLQLMQEKERGFNLALLILVLPAGLEPATPTL